MAGPFVVLSLPWGQLIHTYTFRTISTVWSRQGAGTALPSTATGEWQGQFSHLPQSLRSISPLPHHHMADEGRDQISQARLSTAPPTPCPPHTRIRGISTVLSIKNISMDEIEDVAFLMHCQLEPINIHLYVCMLYVHTQCHLWMYFVYGK